MTLEAVRAGIERACAAAGRDPNSVRLVAVSKGQGTSKVRAAAAAGQRVFGESYAAEMKRKRLELAGLPELEWHFIGRVQTGNAKEISTATLVHGVGSLDQARALAKRAATALLQLSLWDEATKNGFTEAELTRDLPAIRELPGLAVRGFMAIPPPDAPARAAFARVRALRDRHAPDLLELSMGMSGDYEDAIREGATLVRVGTAIFGPREAR